MLLMYPTADAEKGVLPEPRFFDEMMKFNEALQKAGVLLALDGLQPSSKGARVSLRGGKRTVTDGPFTETKEIVGGFWMIDVRSKEEAVEWAARAPVADFEFIEVRQVYETQDFPEDVQRVVEDRLDAVGPKPERRTN
jgi:hypothetical protein